MLTRPFVGEPQIFAIFFLGGETHRVVTRLLLKLIFSENFSACSGLKTLGKSAVGGKLPPVKNEPYVLWEGTQRLVRACVGDSAVF